MRRRHRRLLRRRHRRAARALDGVRASSSRSAATTRRRTPRAQEPWAFGEPYESRHARHAAAAACGCSPTSTALFDEAHRTGAPILRPLLFEHPGDEATYAADDEFLLGDALLVAPIARPGIEHRHVYLPAGTWVHCWTGERIEGPAHVLAHAPLGRPALYARANAAVPLWPEREHTNGEPGTLTLRIFAAPGAPDAERALFEDAGEGFGDDSRRNVRCAVAGEAATVTLSEREGGFVPARDRLELELRGPLPAPSTVEVDGRPHDAWRHEDGAVLVELAERPEATVIVIERMQ